MARAAMVLLVLACSERVTAPPRLPIAETVSFLGSGRANRTTRQEWKELAVRYPGFAGVWMEGDTVVIGASRSGALQAIHDAAGGWLLSGGRSDLLMKPWRIHRVAYDFNELDSVRRQLDQVLVPNVDVNSFWIDSKRARAVVGVSDAATARWAEGVASQLNLPADSYSIEVTGRAEERTCSTLQSLCSPVVAGLQILNVAGNSYCSIGFVGWKNDSLQPSQPDYSYKVVMSAAHCTSSQTQVVGDAIYQPNLTRVIGYEVDEAPVYGATTCQAYGTTYVNCRFADVAVFRIHDTVSVAGGYTAVANSVTPPAVPQYQGMTLYTGSSAIAAIVGEGVARVGHVSGQTYGLVTHECVDRRAGLTSIWTFCMQRAAIKLRIGDSGGLVYVTTICCSTPPVPRPAGISSQEDVQNTPGMFYSKTSSVLGALGWKYFVTW